MLVSCKGIQAKYIIRGLQGKMRIGLTSTTVMGESQWLFSRIRSNLKQRLPMLSTRWFDSISAVPPRF